MTSMMKPAEDGYRPAYETIAAKITELITSDDLKPGDRLPTEHELSEQLGVSRTVVREAVKVLVATGLVYTRRGSGLYVANKASSLHMTVLDSLTPADPTQVIGLYEFRLMLEPTAARLAAERGDPTTPAVPRDRCGLTSSDSRSNAQSIPRLYDSYDNPCPELGVRHCCRTHTGIAAILCRATCNNTRSDPGGGARCRCSSHAGPPGMGTVPFQTRDAATTWR